MAGVYVEQCTGFKVCIHDAIELPCRMVAFPRTEMAIDTTSTGSMYRHADLLRCCLEPVLG
jgi:hypothetical protein